MSFSRLSKKLPLFAAGSGLACTGFFAGRYACEYKETKTRTEDKVERERQENIAKSLIEDPPSIFRQKYK